MAEQARLEVTVHGIVQGVSFRYYARREANGLGLTGWVRNQWDGTVEVVAEGERDRLDRLLAWLHRGPSGAMVTQIDADWDEPRGEFSTFEVRY